MKRGDLVRLTSSNATNTVGFENDLLRQMELMAQQIVPPLSGE